MAVTGTIGNEQVFLDNAATEATMKQLLAAVQQWGGAQAAAKTAATASAAGINPTTVNEANNSLSGLKTAVNQTSAAFWGSVQPLASGTATVSGVLAGFTGLPGPIGDVILVFQKLAAFQEENMLQYRSMSQAGANFSGNLIEMRLAAQNAYIDLKAFGDIIKANSTTLARMGGSVTDGARAFAAMSNSLISSDAGTTLMSLGYTAEELNDGLVKYIGTTGGRTKEELKNTAAITQATTEYLTELDKVTQFTGTNRKAMEEEQKKAAANNAFQRKLASMGETERAKLKAAYDSAAASGIAGATDAVMSLALGMPPLTKEAAQFAGTLPDAYNGLTDMTNTAMQAGSTMDDVRLANGKFVMGAVQGAEQLGATGDALALTGNNVVNGALGLQNQMNSKGITTAEGYASAFKEIGDNQKKQAASQATEMAKNEKNLKELGQAIMNVVGPIAGALTPAIKYLVPAVLALGAVAVATKFSWAVYDAFVKAKTAKEQGSSLFGAAGAALGRTPGGASPISAGPLGAMQSTQAPAGGGFVGFIKSLGRGLASLAPIAVPMLIGAGAVAGVITLLGAGVAAAIALVGLSLPTFAKGIKEIAEIDGVNLIKVAGGIGALGVAMVAFGTGSALGGIATGFSKVVGFFTGGGVVGQIKDTVGELTPILPQLTALGPAINTYAQGIVAFGRAVSTVDIAKAAQLKEVLKGPSAAESIANAGAQMIQAATSVVTGNKGGEEKTHLELAALNNTMKELVKYMRDTSENTKKTHDATRALNGDFFASA